MFKRLIDLVLSASVLLFTLPALAVLAILIRRDSHGPALFRQTRMGRNFQSFEILKLRTMREIPGPTYTLGDDRRVTSLGRWLRRTKIDEIPQLWNVLRGQMSLTGPRPVVPALTFEFREEYKRLLTVRPGLTDPATLKYCRETELLAKSENPLAYFKDVVTPDKLRISLEYLENASLWSDVKLMLRTAVLLLRGTRSQKLPQPVVLATKALPPFRLIHIDTPQKVRSESFIPTELLFSVRSATPKLPVNADSKAG